MLCNRVSIQGYKECQGDITAVSEMAECIRDALLEYQVGRSRMARVMWLTLGRFDRQPSSRQHMTRIVG